MLAVFLEQVPVPEPARCLQADDLLRYVAPAMSMSAADPANDSPDSSTSWPLSTQACKCAECMRPDSYALVFTAGKTLTVHAVAHACAKEARDAASPPVLLSINCMTLQAPSHVFRRILDGLNASRQTASSADSFVRPGGSHPCFALDILSPG